MSASRSDSTFPALPPFRSLQRFHCVEQLGALMAATGMPLQLTQLAGGSLQGDLLALRLAELTLLRIRIDRPVHVRGAKDPRQQGVCLDLTPPLLARPSRSHGIELPATAVCGLARSGEVHITVPAGAELALLNLPQESFSRTCAELGCEALDEGVLARNWLVLDPLRFNDLRRVLRQLFAQATRQQWPPDLLERDLLPLLLEALVHAAGLSSHLARPPARIQLVQQAQRWLDEHQGQPLTLQDLCQGVYGSRRSLIQGFREHLGMGPMAYVKLQRLHAARRALLHADPEEVTVLAVAADHGFLNHGHFARDYQLLFGEPPSATLRDRPSGRLFSAGRTRAAAPPPGRSG